jgi:hypothetical protein
MKTIISRYKEDIGWAIHVPNPVIYNKGEPLSDSRFTIRTLPNVGREGHTIYTYIYEHYDTLDDYTAFLQGTPFDHSPHVIQNIHRINALIQKGEYIKGFEYLSEYITDLHVETGCPWNLTLPLKRVYTTLFGEEKGRMNIRMGAGAQFVVSKEYIRSNPREFYLKLIQLLEYSIDPIEGHVIERFHEIILDKSYRLDHV